MPNRRTPPTRESCAGQRIQERFRTGHRGTSTQRCYARGRAGAPTSGTSCCRSRFKDCSPRFFGPSNGIGTVCLIEPRTQATSASTSWARLRRDCLGRSRTSSRKCAPNYHRLRAGFNRTTSCSAVGASRRSGSRTTSSKWLPRRASRSFWRYSREGSTNIRMRTSSSIRSTSTRRKSTCSRSAMRRGPHGSESPWASGSAGSQSTGALVDICASRFEASWRASRYVPHSSTRGRAPSRGGTSADVHDSARRKDRSDSFATSGSSTSMTSRPSS